MSIQSVLLPLFVQVALTFVLLFWMGGVRFTAVRNREVHARDIALGQSNWPPRITQIGNAYHNQLQLPVLFYILVVLALVTRQADAVFVVLAWLFVVLRIAHVYVHVTTNRLSRRFFVFTAGALVLAVMWIIYAVRILVVTG
jgi:hypothetical protein